MFSFFLQSVLEYCSSVWCLAADSHLKLLDRVVSGVSFLTEGVFECDLAHRRSVAVLWMLHKIRCNSMQSLYGALPVPYVPVRVTRGALAAHGSTCAPPRSRTTQYLLTLILLSVPLWNDVADPEFDGVGLSSFKSSSKAFFIFLCCCIPFCLLLFFPFLFFLSIL